MGNELNKNSASIFFKNEYQFPDDTVDYLRYRSPLHLNEIRAKEV